MRTTEFLRKHEWLLMLLPPLIALLVYLPSLQNGFALIDDGLLIFENNLVRELSLKTLRVAFTSYDPELYIPLTFVSYQSDYLLGGYNPLIYHLTNLLLHMGSTFLVSAFIFYLTKRSKLAIACALLFAIHPITVETVVWAAARKDVLSGFFFLLSATLYLLSIQKQSTLRSTFTSFWYWLSFFAFLLALLSKVTAITLPLILLLCDLHRGRRDYKEVVLEKTPYFLLALLFGLIALFGKATLLAERSPLEHFLLACKMVILALSKILVPLRLSVFYPELGEVTLFHPTFLLSLLILIILGAVVWMFRQKKLLLFGALFFLITLAPAALTFMKGGNTFLFSDRYAYLPSLGVIFLAAHLLDENFRRKFSIINFQFSISSVVLFFVLLTFIPLTISRSLLWGDSVSLFAKEVEQSPQFYLAHINLGASLHRMGKSDQAIAEFRRAIELHPIPNTYGLIGEVEAERGKYVEAVRAFEEGLMLLPEDPELLYGLGQVYALMGEGDKALTSYERALNATKASDDPYRSFARRISARRDMILLRMGVLTGERGDHERALALYTQAIEENPFNAEAHYNAAVSLGNLARNDEAIAEYAKAVDFNPQDLRARINLGILLARAGRTLEAIKEFKEALKIDPANTVAKEALRALGG